jgi:hypothetical protein
VNAVRDGVVGQDQRFAADLEDRCIVVQPLRAGMERQRA